MNPSLYEMLSLNFSNELPIEQVNHKDSVILSVMDNIQRILSTRRGAISHLPEYGLPDFSLVLQGLPASAQYLIEDIHHAIITYEPRAKRIQLKLLPSTMIGYLRYALVLELEHVGEVTFQSGFTPDGKVVMRHLKQQRRISEV